MIAHALRRRLRIRIERLAYAIPFRISGYTFDEAEVVVVAIEEDGYEGRGESSGIYFLDETPETMAAEIETLRSELESGLSRKELQTAMPANGARNALDCALWELEARLTAKPAWTIAGINKPRPLLTTYTIGADEPTDMAAVAAEKYASTRALKLKLVGDADTDAERIRAVRRARPDVWIGVDANQGFTPKTLETLLPALLDADVKLVEQPFSRERISDLEGFPRPIPFALDESVLNLGDIHNLVGLTDMINIKLDKCGGLTEGLAMAAEARRLGLGVMVGNMGGSSLAMAPAFILGQLCDIVDLDGPLLLSEDRRPGATYHDGYVDCGDTVWGYPTAAGIPRS